LTTSSAPAHGARRVIFIDLVRALAVAFMFTAHGERAARATVPGGDWFDIWQFQRGLTSSLFLLLGGFASASPRAAAGHHTCSGRRPWSSASGGSGSS
jgi:uncharacterized membrane protein